MNKLMSVIAPAASTTAGATPPTNPAPISATPAAPTLAPTSAPPTADIKDRINLVGMLCDTLFEGRAAKLDLLRELERLHAIAEVALDTNRRWALANRKVANREIRQEWDVLGTQVAAARNAWQQATDDLEKQQAVLAGLVAEQAANIKVKALKKVEPKGREFSELVDRLSTVAEEIDNDTRNSGVTWGELLGDQGDFKLSWMKHLLYELVHYRGELKKPWLVKGAA